jgi:5-(carboxyamino)imidazole ribonucleotide synthase
VKTRSVGVIGGGQLARMMIAPATELAIDIKVFAEAEGSPAALAATVVGDYTNFESVLAFARTVDVITFDHEHVPLTVLRGLEAAGMSVQPSSHSLNFAQNKLEMRKGLAELYVPCPNWAQIEEAAALDEFIAANAGFAVVKTATGGYDGKGVRVVQSSEQVRDWLALGKPLLVEQKVEFKRELAQLIARNLAGQIEAWPVVQTIQRDGVCAEVHSPAQGADSQAAEAIARTIAEGLGVTGVLAVEMFETADGKLLVNELAMRPHNSGHFSIEGSVTSQFEQHLRAVLNLPLGSTEATAKHAVMLNLLGVDDQNTFVEHYDHAMAKAPEAKIHVYGKAARLGRKMGHVTATSNSSVDEAVAIARTAANALLQA